MKKIFLVVFLCFSVLESFSQFCNFSEDDFIQLNTKAVSLIAKGKKQQASELFYSVNAKVQQSCGKDALEYIHFLGELAFYAGARELNDCREKLLLEQKQYCEKFHLYITPEYAFCLVDLGYYYFKIESYDKAEKLFFESLKVYKRLDGENDKDYVLVLYSLAELYQKQGKFKDAEDMLADGNSYCEARIDSMYEDYVYGCVNLANLYQSAGMYDRAEDILKKAENTIQVYSTTEDDFRVFYIDLANFYRSQGKFELAEKYFHISLQKTVALFGTEHGEYGVQLLSIARFYKDQDILDSAEKYFVQGLDVLELSRGKNVQYADGLRGLADLYMMQGSNEKAEPLFLQMLELKEKMWGNKHSEYGLACWHYAQFLFQQYRFKEAEKYFLKDLEIVKRNLGTNHPDHAASCNNLAGFYQATGDYRKAEYYYNFALQNKMNEVDVLIPAFTETERQDYIRNLNRYFLDYYDFGLQNHFSSVYLRKLADVQLRMKGLIFNSSKRMREQILSSKDQKLIDNYHLWKEKREQLAQALQMSVEEKKKNQINEDLLKEEVDILERSLSETSLAFKENKNASVDWQAVQKSLGKNEAMVEIIRATDFGRKTYTYEYRGKGFKFDTVNYIVDYVYDAAPAKEAGIKIGDRIISINGITITGKNYTETKSLFQKYTYEIAYIKDGGLDTIVTQLSTGDVFSEFEGNAPVYLYLITTPETKEHPILIVEDNGEALETKYLRYYRNCIKLKKADTISYDIFWGKLEKYLAGVERIYISSDGIYHQLNLETLYQPKVSKYLTDMHTVQLVSNCADIIKFKNKDDKLNNNLKDYLVHLFGYPDYYGEEETAGDAVPSKEFKSDSANPFLSVYGKVESLPGTKAEVENIYNLSEQKFSSFKYLGKEATEEKFKSIRDPYIMHIATHGYFFPDDEEIEDTIFSNSPLMRSGLLLANCASTSVEGKEDGLLTAFEAMNLYLEKTELVILSACETGLGEITNGEGVYGLHRSFQQAGAKTVMMSLWKVNDDATQLMMSSFYKYLLEGKGKREAFTLAQKDVRKKFPEPYYWGAFVMVGE